MSLAISEQQRDLYRTEGYMILPAVIPPYMLAILREKCSYYLGYYDSLMDARGAQTENLSHRGKRYFINTAIGSATVSGGSSSAT